MSGKKLKVTLKGDAELKVTRSSGNVFADMGLPNPEEERAKVDLALAIKRTIAEKGMTQVSAAQAAKESQPNISNIVGGRLRSFSCERLMRILTALGKDVEVSIKDAPQARERGQLIIIGQDHIAKKRPRYVRG